MRVSPINPRQAPWYLKPVYWLQKRHYGQILLPGLLWGRQPGLMLGVAFLFGRLVRKGTALPPDLRALVCVRISQINHCDFCVDINGAGFLNIEGVLRDKLQELSGWRDSSLFDDRERCVLAYAEAVTDSRERVEDPLFDFLRRYFDDDGLVLLTGLIAFQNMSSKFNAALAVPPQGFCRIPAGGEE